MPSSRRHGGCISGSRVKLSGKPLFLRTGDQYVEDFAFF